MLKTEIEIKNRDDLLEKIQKLDDLVSEIENLVSEIKVEIVLR